MTISFRPDSHIRILSVPARGLVISFKITRADGAVCKPSYVSFGSSYSLSLKLYANSSELIFSGSSRYFKQYESDVPGLIRSCSLHHYTGLFQITLDRGILSNEFGLSGDIQLKLTTEGLTPEDKTFLTSHSVSQGMNDLKIPLWHVLETIDIQNNGRAFVRNSHVWSSVPFSVDYKIENANSLGNFKLPVLGVVWTPNADLSGWIGLFQITNICSQGTIAIPWQFPEGVTQPAQPPSSPEDRIFTVYNNVMLRIALSECPSRWNETQIECLSNFGNIEFTIPYSGSGSELFNFEPELDDEPPCINKKVFQRIYSFNWDRSSFQYDTGESPSLFLNQTATLQNTWYAPALYTDFETLSFTPLSEESE